MSEGRRHSFSVRRPRYGLSLRGPSDCPWVQWILGEDTEVCSMIGVNGQFVLIDPCHDVVIVKLSSYPVRRLQDTSFVRGLAVTWSWHMLLDVTELHRRVG